MKVVFLCPTSRSAIQFRKGLMLKHISEGNDLTVICSADEFSSDLEKIPAEIIYINFSRFYNIFSDIVYFLSIYKHLKKIKPELVHAFTIKPNFYGAIASKILGIKKIFITIEGLGFLFLDNNQNDLFHLTITKLKKCIVKIIYRVACSISSKTWLINRENVRFLQQTHIIKKEKIFYTSGIGVDSDQYNVNNVSMMKVKILENDVFHKENQITFTLIARMIWSKGVKEFIESAIKVYDKFKNTKFLIIGEIQKNSPDSVTEEYLLSLPKNVFWLGLRKDINEILSLTDVFVLPSYYPEGLPRSILEAMCFGLPIITTDNPGCNEVVFDNINGIIVRPRNVEMLCNAMINLTNNTDLRAKFGEYSLRLIETELNEKSINKKVFEEMYQIP